MGGIIMPDWKEMYLTLMRETERAINTLIDAQRRCEELYLQSGEKTPPEEISSK